MAGQATPVWKSEDNSLIDELDALIDKRLTDENRD
jgi:hypothetical protein